VPAIERFLNYVCADFARRAIDDDVERRSGMAAAGREQQRQEYATYQCRRRYL
jgi:hypothetical protein